MAREQTDYDLYLFHEGTQAFSYRFMGAHLCAQNGIPGVWFSVWAPNATLVCVTGDFNHWSPTSHPMQRVTKAGVWSLFVPDLLEGALYKYAIHTLDGSIHLKADPYAFWAEVRPNTASRVASLAGYVWNDADWMAQRREQTVCSGPLLIYEVHLGSWRRGPNDEELTYRQLAEVLPQYAADMGYTHIELLPVAEHPFDGSWGYQVTGYFAVTSRYGPPLDFMYFVDCCHQLGLGVILDWVPGHFCADAHGLARFDGVNLYEHGDPLRAHHPEWGTLHFDYGRDEVRSFLISNAVFWCDVYHIDGLRTDAVSSMLFYDHERGPGQWRPNKYGGRENLEAIRFLQDLNETVYAHFPDVLMIAEESTAYPKVSHPVHEGGLGFRYKWNMGWMRDSLHYMEEDPLFRKHLHNQLTFSLVYAFSENFILALSHDEVVHGKRSLLDKMPGDHWRKFAGLRAFYGYMMAHPGKKLLFMGGEFGQWVEWRFYSALDWHLLEYEPHVGLHRFVRSLNWFYRKDASFWENDQGWDGFKWLDPHAADHSILAFLRQGKDPETHTVVVCNFTPQVHHGYRIGVPQSTDYVEVMNSDSACFGGSGQTNGGPLPAVDIPWQGQPYSIHITVPPLATVYFHCNQGPKGATPTTTTRR